MEDFQKELDSGKVRKFTLFCLVSAFTRVLSLTNDQGLEISKLAYKCCCVFYGTRPSEADEAAQNRFSQHLWDMLLFSFAKIL